MTLKLHLLVPAVGFVPPIAVPAAVAPPVTVAVAFAVPVAVSVAVAAAVTPPIAISATIAAAVATPSTRAAAALSALLALLAIMVIMGTVMTARDKTEKKVTLRRGASRCRGASPTQKTRRAYFVDAELRGRTGARARHDRDKVMLTLLTLCFLSSSAAAGSSSADAITRADTTLGTAPGGGRKRPDA